MMDLVHFGRKKTTKAKKTAEREFRCDSLQGNTQPKIRFREDFPIKYCPVFLYRYARPVELKNGRVALKQVPSREVEGSKHVSLRRWMASMIVPM